jgi:hypothetical protein
MVGSLLGGHFLILGGLIGLWLQDKEKLDVKIATAILSTGLFFLISAWLLFEAFPSFRFLGSEFVKTLSILESVGCLGLFWHYVLGTPWRGRY